MKMIKALLVFGLLLNFSFAQSGVVTTESKIDTLMEDLSHLGSLIIDNYDTKTYLTPVGLGFGIYALIIAGKIKDIKTITNVVSGVDWVLYEDATGLLQKDLFSYYKLTFYLPENGMPITVKFSEKPYEKASKWTRQSKYYESLTNENRAGTINRLTNIRNIFGGLALGVIGIAIGDVIYEQFIDDGKDESSLGTLSPEELQRQSFEKIAHTEARNVRAFLNNNPDLTNEIYENRLETIKN